MTSHKVSFLFVLLVFVTPATTLAQLALDPTFGNGGKVTTPIIAFTDEGANALAVDSQDRILTAYSGYDTIGISRHLPDGSLDPSFGDNGIKRLNFGPSDLVLQADGKIIVVGSRANDGPYSEDWQVVRLLVDGGLDSSFASGGVLTVDWYGGYDIATTVALTVAGHIIVGGRAATSPGAAFALLLVDASGTILKQQADKLGTGTFDTCQKVLVQPDGKIVCAGFLRKPNYAVMGVTRYLPNFQLDPTFGTGGVATVAFDGGQADANSAVLLSTGALIIGGFVERSYDRSLAMARLTASGVLDTAFGVDGRVEHSIPGDSNETIHAMLQFQSSLFVAARTHEIGKFGLLRFDINGTLDTGFGDAGLALADFNGGLDSGVSLAVHQGALLVGGSASALNENEGRNIGLARFLTGGALDTSFSGNGLREVSLRGPVIARALDAVAQSDGKIVVAGHVGSSAFGKDFAVVRYHPDGSLDTTFGEQGIVVTDFANGEDNGIAIAAQSDGRVLVAGEVRVTFSVPIDFGVARYTTSGALDTSFGVNGKVSIDVDGDSDYLRAISVQNDGRILLAGYSTFPSLGYARNMTVVRLMADGSRDTMFGTNGIASVSIATSDIGAALAVQSDGKILIGGGGTGTGGGDFTLARFTTAGLLDTAFGNNGIVTFDFAGHTDFMTDMLILPDWMGMGERILAVGSARSESAITSQTFGAVLFDLDGNPEPGFGNSGSVMFDLVPGQQDVATSVAVLGERLVIAGYSTQIVKSEFAMLGLTMDGAEDPSFTTDGSATLLSFFATVSEANAVITSPAGEVILVGWAWDPTRETAGNMFALARFAVSDVVFSDSFETF